MSNIEGLKSNITLKQVRSFLEIARLNSFTRASERLGITQSSLSVLINELESELQTRLLERTTRMVALTEAGREFLPYAERLLVILNDGIDATREIASRRRGEIHVVASPLAAVALLPPALSQFQQNYQGIHVTLSEFPPDQISTRVAQSFCDCGIGVFDSKDDGLITAPLIKGVLMVLCPPGHALTAKSEVDWSDLLAFPIITIRQESAARRRMDYQFAKAGISLEPAFEVRNMVTILGMVAANMGISIWPSWALTLAGLFNLELRPLVRPTAIHTLSVITSKDRPISPAATALIETIKSQVDAQRVHEPS